MGEVAESLQRKFPSPRGVTEWVCLSLAIAAGGALASYVAGVPNVEEEEQLLRQ